MENTPQQSPDWQDWIDRIGNNDVSEQELRDFQKLVEESPENMDDYLDALLTETSLEMKGGLLTQHVQAPEVPTPVAVPVAPAVSIAQPIRSTGGIGNVAKFAIAASVSLLLGLSYFLGRGHTSSPSGSDVVEHVATITDSNKVADAAGLLIGKPLHTGEIVVPADAKIGIAMRGGARLEINGPASLRIDGPENVFLHKGRIQTYAPEYAHGFTVDTHEGKVVDLGTRFVTSTGSELGTEIHCLEGLVKARATDGGSKMTHIGGEQAAILKNGKMLDTDFLAQRLSIPINPNLPDSDGDRVIDVVEGHYRTNSNDPHSTPSLLRISESFNGYAPESINRTAYRGVGKIPQWVGGGSFLEQGLTYQNNGKSLLTSGGCLQTTGENGVGAKMVPDSKELPQEGVIYISFLMQQPTKEHIRAFSGLLLYRDDYKEQMFTGELSVANSYGSRYAESDEEDPFAVSTDDKPHLFVIRIDQTRFLTDIFLDPPLGKPESEIRSQRRYQDAPKFESIVVRSGSDSGNFPVRFDEMRVGLTWDSVLPLNQ